MNATEKPRKQLTDADLLASPYTAWMGHQFVVLRDHPEQGRSVYAEVNTAARAKKFADEGGNGTAYQRLTNGTWRKLPKGRKGTQ